MFNARTYLMALTDVDHAPMAIRAMASNATELTYVVLILASQVRNSFRDLVCPNESLLDLNCFGI